MNINRSRPWRWLATLALAGMVLVGACEVEPPPPTPGGAPIVAPLSTSGSDIVDATGRVVTLRGVNWFGFETEINVVHGLWARDYREMLHQIRSLGYDTIRLPWSVESLRASSISGVNYSLGANAELQGLTPLEAMDRVIDAAADEGLLILLDNHRLNDEWIPELWYGDGFTEQDWIDSWLMLAERYGDRSNVIGADLKNEPHGAATWGTGVVATDWRLAAERAGNAVLGIAPHWLIVVEGIGGTVEGQQLPGHWWGGNLEGAGRWPVRLDVPDRLVYSPHEYGPGVHDQPWFSETDVPATLRHRWDTGFGYLVDGDIAPVLVGEFGGREVGLDTVEGWWQNLFVDYLAEKDISFTYWSWNPNSTDTGGILMNDWTTVHAAKQQMLDRLLVGGVPPPSTTTTSSPSSTTSTSTTAPDPASITASFRVTDDWGGGYCGQVGVGNAGGTAAVVESVSFALIGATVTSSWNGVLTVASTDHSVVLPEWGRNISAGSTVESFGFCAARSSGTSGAFPTALAAG